MLLEPTLAAIELDVAPLLFTASVLHQKARPHELTLRFLPNGDVELVLVLLRQAYGVAADGRTGDPVPATYGQLPPVRLLATREVAVDPNDGFPRYRLRTPTSAYNTRTQQVEDFAAGQDWLAFLRAQPGTYMLQDRYFGLLCAREQVNIFDLLLTYGEQADAEPSMFAVQP